MLPETWPAASKLKSGLGLAAQQRKIGEFLSPSDELKGEFCDVQSGRDDGLAVMDRSALTETATMKGHV
jgi:hypothetical protein